MRLKGSSLLDNLFSLSLIVIGNCFKICRGWFDWLFTNEMLEFGFLKGKYVLVLRFSSMSRKSVCFSPASAVILKPHLANIFLSDFDH